MGGDCKTKNNDGFAFGDAGYATHPLLGNEIPVKGRGGVASGSESWMTIALLITIPSKYFVYLLKSLKDKKYYIGQTNDIKNRLEQHNDGKVISTKSRRPLVLIGYEEHKNQNEARWAEYQYKHHSDKKKKFIEKLLTKI